MRVPPDAVHLARQGGMSAQDLKIDMRGWPAGLVELAEVVGPEAALILQRDWGGIRLYVPRNLDESHPIALAIGWDAALKLCQWRPGEQLLLPSLYAARSRKAMIAAAKGSHAQIARALGVTERHVRGVKAGAREEADTNQDDLFG